MIEVSGLKKWFYEKMRGRFLAVDDVSFSCNAGEVYGLLGPNGAGKTTTLLMASSIMRPDTGTVTIEGEDAHRDSTRARRLLGFTCTGAGLYDLLTPRELITFAGKLYGYAPKELKERVDHLIETLEITRFADSRCKGLSTGMKQKVSLARALVHNPPVLILDEPTVGLDVITCQSLHEIIREFRAQGKCIVYSTHIMSEAEKLCDRIGIINNGKILLEGTLEHLRATTNKESLEEVFLHVVKKPSADAE